MTPVKKKHILERRDSPTDILKIVRDRSKYGVIVDLSCDLSTEFLMKSSNDLYFNSSFTWIIISDKEDTGFVEDLTLSLDSDFVIVTPSGRVVDFHKTGRNEGLLIDQQLGSLDQQLEERNPRNGRGITVNIGLIVKDEPDEEGLQTLADPTFKSKDYPGLRVAIPISLAIRDSLNLTFKVILSDDWGSNPGQKGNWTGYVGLYQRGEIEFTFHPLKFRKDRMDVVDIPFPLLEGRSVYLFLQPPMFGSPTALIVPLENEVWLSLAVITALFMMAFRIISKFEESPDLENWSAVWIHTLGTIAQQGFNDTTNLVSIRMSSFSLLFFSFMLYLYYGAAVLNGLLSPSPSSINTEQQLLDTNMKIAILDVPYMRDLSSDESLIGPFTPETVRMLEKAKSQDRMFYSMEEGIEIVKDGRYTFIADAMGMIPFLRKELTDVQICSSSLINKIPPFSIGLNMRKMSPFKQLWMNKVAWIYEVGLVRRTKSYWIPSKPPCVWQTEALSIGLKATVVAVALSALGLVVSLLMLPLEMLHYRKYHSASRRIHD